MRPTRTYTAAEVEAIISLAFELKEGSQENLTLAEVEASANELGIEPHFIQQAALALEPKPEPPIQEPATRSRAAFLVSTVAYLALLVAAAIQTSYGSGNNLVYAFLFAASFALGVTFPIRNWMRLFMIPFFTTIIVTAIVRLVAERFFGQRTYESEIWQVGTLVATIGQLLFAMLGLLVVRGAEYLLRDYRDVIHRGRRSYR